ncbi:hypothetical protein VTK56DRAFT_5892 [Thermocarpiscus australiensis]
MVVPLRLPITSIRKSSLTQKKTRLLETLQGLRFLIWVQAQRVNLSLSRFDSQDISNGNRRRWTKSITLNEFLRPHRSTGDRMLIGDFVAFWANNTR